MEVASRERRDLEQGDEKQSALGRIDLAKRIDQLTTDRERRLGIADDRLDDCQGCCSLDAYQRLGSLSAAADHFRFGHQFCEFVSRSRQLCFGRQFDSMANGPRIVSRKQRIGHFTSPCFQFTRRRQRPFATCAKHGHQYGSLEFPILVPIRQRRRSTSGNRETSIVLAM